MPDLCRIALSAARLLALTLPAACSANGADSRAATVDGTSRTPGAPRDAGATSARCTKYSAERQPFFGDLHVHTALSLDANLQGTRLRPLDAYRFARGERVGLPPYDASGAPLRTLQLERPLDFVAVSDHAEFLGLVTTCLTPGLSGYDSAACARFREQPGEAFIQLNAQLAVAQGQAQPVAPCTPDNAYCGSAAQGAWSEIRAAAQAAQDESDACTFTSFVAYEWSASPGTKNLHRNVIFASDQLPDLPFSYLDGNREEELWDALERDCLKRPGCDVLTIPHNSNLSAGLMFQPLDRRGEPWTRSYAERRAKFEPLVELFQHKGSSECLPALGADELCDFEKLPHNTLGTATLGGPGDLLLTRDYVRAALGQGLLLGRSLGANPFAYGFVASTDSHLGTPGAVDEGSYAGHGGAGTGARAPAASGLVDNVWFNPGGLAVLWAEENSRTALFAAMKRREAYGTSGPRIVLRLFAGFELSPTLCASPQFARDGYQQGVAMGGELTRTAQQPGAAPRFAAWALRDPATRGNGLERIQIVKGYLAEGEPKYAVYDIAGAPAAVAVDPATCLPSGQGADELCNVWSDPEFDPTQPAFYYARVLETPSCRWHTSACLQAGVDCGRPETQKPGYEACCLGGRSAPPPTQQERAWSSPIFYQPG